MGARRLVVGGLVVGGAVGVSLVGWSWVAAVPTGQGGGAGATTAPVEAKVQGEARVPSFQQDRAVWHGLLREHVKIRRAVRHLPDGVETLTESDDSAVAGRIREHAVSMEARLRRGESVRRWDPVFEALFARHGAVTLAVTPTERGVKVVETSADPEAVALLRSHALGVNHFVRRGMDGAHDPTPRLASSDPVPTGEVAVGGVPHRVLLSQPTADQLAGLKAAGVTRVVNFRPAGEHEGYDEAAAAERAGLGYVNIPYGGPAELNDEILDAARAALKDAAKGGEVLALHCRTGNRVGPGWVAYRVLDLGVPLEQALAEAAIMQSKDPAMMDKARAYVEARR